ncbi:hypothetical protein K8R04_00120 [Candidatus Uhrbacteria bacterium]|nr:hypothetical protein [Candidatus Uhrbacteria bacterium]
MAALVCREMGWTWEQFQEQPSWFIDVLTEMFQAEGEHSKKEIEKAK